MITFSNKHRSQQAEIMDDLDFQSPEMKDLLNDLKLVNTWLDGNNITLKGIQKLLQNRSQTDKITVVDFGCGDGELLRKCADFGKKNNFNFEFIGIDFNENILQFAKMKSSGYTNIKFQKLDVFSEENLIPNCDIALCTLFLHHFPTEKIERLLKTMIHKTSIGLVINDLQRSKLAFELFKVASAFFLKSKIARHDGLVSVARGFKKVELQSIADKFPNQKSEIHWRWAYRYQWILKKTV